ncbi:MAG: diguanylate cyclase domain-containing protein, partial [Microvirgula sp.]
MKCPAIQANEKERLLALEAYGLEDGQPLPSLDPVVHIAARMSGMPVAAVNMIGSDHVFFAASTGVGEVDMRRDVSFCAHAINHPDGMVVPDTMLDERFHDNPLVIGAAGVRFYAGVPLLSPDGLALGALCILDRRPHPEFSEEEWLRLRELARMASDRLELRRIAVSAERTRPKFDEYASGSLTPVIWFDEDGDIVAWNDAAAAVYGYPQAEGAGCAVDSLLAEDERPAFRALIAQAVEAGSLDRLDVPAELNGLCRNGQVLRLGFSLFCWRDAGRLMFEAVLRDQTAQRRERDELRQQACFDALTGLANRSRFYRCVEAVLTRSEPAVVLMIDLDGFKDINDTLGHALGDSILREVAIRLSHMAGQADTVARIGGDEFAVLLTGISDPEQASQVADSAIASLGRTMVIDGHEI